MSGEENPKSSEKEMKQKDRFYSLYITCFSCLATITNISIKILGRSQIELTECVPVRDR